MRDYPRNLDLIRKILITREANESVATLDVEDVVRYHLRLMIEAGLLNGRVVEYAGGYEVMLMTPRITNAGHDLLASIRSEAVWRQVLNRIIPLGGGIALELLTEVAKREGRRLLGLES